MGYAELVRVLGAEVRREKAAIAEEAVRERQRLLDEARRELEAARARALAKAEAELADRRRRAADAARVERRRTLLVEQRRILDELAEEALRRLAAQGDPGLRERLIGELRAELDAEAGGGAHAEIVASPAGGVEARVGDRLILDNTMPSRLAKLWPLVEARIAAVLFGAEDGAV
jgi:vacuolar-type H+-ATPase subunit E/Vma4